MDGCAHIVCSSVGCHALPGSESVGVPMFDLVNASQFGQSRPAFAEDAAKLPASRRAIGGRIDGQPSLYADRGRT